MADNKEIIKKKRTLLQKIVNVFLYTWITLLLIFIELFGISQTLTFREFLRNEVISIANNELNGHVSIGKIDGTIFTSLILHNTIVSMGADTVMNAGTIEVRTSPLDIFLKRIYVRKIEIADTKIAFVADSSGALNISKLFPTTPKDSVHSKFPFEIVAPDVKLTNVNFSMKDFNNKAGNREYDYLNLHDLSVKDLNLSLVAALDIGNNIYDVQINSFSFVPNIKNFKLDDLSGEFVADSGGVFINNLKIVTAGSDIYLKAKVIDFNLFDSTAFSKIDKAEFNVNLKASKFNFDDLSAFITPVNFLKGNASLELEAAGNLKELAYNKIALTYNDTHLEMRGKIKDVLDVNKMFITADFRDSRIRESDADKLLPSFGIPVYKDYGIIKFDTLRYEGNPLNFKTTAFFRSDRGSAGVSGSMDLRKDDTQYDINFFTRNLNLAPLTGITTNLTSRGSVKGTGFSPDKMNASLRFLGNGSLEGSGIVDSLQFNADAANKNITYNLNLRSDTTYAVVAGNFDFANSEKPSYSFSGIIKGLNLEAFTGDTSFRSNLNLDLNGSGSNFDPDKLNLYLTMNLSKSVIHNVFIDSTRAIADIRSSDNGERVINLISDLADITFTGNFKVDDAVKLISKESSLIAGQFTNKINSVLYPDSVFNKQVNTGLSVISAKKKKNVLPPPLPPSMNIKYYVEFKDFKLLSLFLGSNQFDIDGDMSGEIKNNGNDVAVSVSTNLNYLKYWEQSNVFFLSGFSLSMDLQNNADSTSLNNLLAELHVSSDRIFAGTDIKNAGLDLKLKNEKADINLSGSIADKSTAKVKGIIDLNDGTIKLDLDSLQYAYNNLSLVNKGRVNINYSRDNIYIDHFDMARNGGEVEISGLLSRYGSQDLKLKISGINGNDLFVNLFNLPSDNTLNANIHAEAEITGNFANPVAVVNIVCDSLSFRNRSLGYLQGILNYSNQDLLVDVHILDTAGRKDKPILLLNGNLPVDLSFTSVDERLIKSKQIDLKLTADSLDLAPLENSLPAIKKVGGLLSSSLSLTGTFDNPEPSGLLTLNDGDFVLESNNLEYNAGIKLSVKGKNINIDSLMLSNPRGTRGGGTMTGSGSALLDNLTPASATINLVGDLKVLSNESKEATPSVYGDLVIQSDGNIQITTDFTKYYVKAPIIVKEANLIFPMSQTGYQNVAQNFIYRFPEDTTKTVDKEQDFEKFIKQAVETNSKSGGSQDNSKFALNYSINASFQNEAVLQFALSRELNQNLTARIRGNIEYDNVDGKTFTSGELNLLEGSTLEFFKSLEATGSIRFESELSNPYLNIVATYKSYYLPPETDAKEEPVAVKIKLNGQLKSLSQNFNKDKNNISVYVGSDNIDNNKADDTKEPSDAFYFIMTGKFASDLSQQQQSQAVGAIKTSNSLSSTATNTATSFAGSVIGGLLNQYIGDAVRSVEIRNIGQTTKWNLIGKFKNFNYTIGGSTDVFQDLSQANVKIEYPLFKSLLIRVERKEAVTQTTISNDMVNELGLKYRFEF